MGLNATHRSLITKARTAGGGEQGIPLDNAICTYLVAIIIQDLQIADHFPDVPLNSAPFFGSSPLQDLRVEGKNFLELFERLVAIRDDADTYFYCLATLHKARLKYERILQTQAIPTVDQVGPRSLLQYGALSPKGLAGFMFWRKWMYDIDNRAGQETGYLFEPIIAYAIGGVPYSAKKSPVKRGGKGSQGRQVDCVVGNKAYEIKIRVTIAASGQGRWGEELEFPKDCQASGFIPVLVVLDPTPNTKLDELRRAFITAGGEAYIGQEAWDHLAEVAGPTMARFIELYVHTPLQEVVAAAPEQLPDLCLRTSNNNIIMEVGEEYLTIARSATEIVTADEDGLPDDVDESGPSH